MKKLMSFAVAAALLTLTQGHASADGPRLFPASNTGPSLFGKGVLLGQAPPPAPQTELPPIPEEELPSDAAPGDGPRFYRPDQNFDAPYPEHAHPEYAPHPEIPHFSPADAPIELFPNVRYRKTRKIAPCAVPMIVSVPDPCACTSLFCKCGPPAGCVNIEICVPTNTCCPPKVLTRKCGRRIRYDFGKYCVDIAVKRGRVDVTYRKRLL